MMENITNAILNVYDNGRYLDYLKAKYVLMVNDLMYAIFSLENSMSPESEEQIEYYMDQLIGLKENLLFALSEFADAIELLNSELNGGKIDDG